MGKIVWCIFAVGALTVALEAQNADANMPGMHMDETVTLPSPHASGGTGWQPASVPEREWMISRGGWDLMAHGVIFATYNQQGGPRGEGKAESVNYLMLMQQHRLGRGMILFARCFPQNR